MKIISYGSFKGIGKYNNDIVNYMDDFCYVMDGATPLFNDNLFFNTSDLYEYMSLLKKNINNNDDINNSFINGIIESNKQLKNIEKYDEYVLPTFTIASIKENMDEYELYLLCDCLISILYKDGTIENIEDNRFNDIKSKSRNDVKNIDVLNKSFDEVLELKRAIWRKYRKYANSGYPVGSTNPNSIDNGIIKKIDKDKVDKIIICTDGFYNALGLPNDNTYFDKYLLENKIKNIKNNDDLTYILITN